MSEDLNNPLARNDHPDTAKQAGIDIEEHLARLEEWALKCVRQSPGCTRRELGQMYTEGDPDKIGRRLCAMERKGVITRGPKRRCRVSGRKVETWLPAA